MNEQRKRIKRRIGVFLTLIVIFTMGAAVLAAKLPGKILLMNEVQAAVVQLETNKEEQTESLKEITSQMGELGSQVQSLEATLEEIKAAHPEQNVEGVKYAYLTFDDGPSGNTVKILDYLKANNIKATFFVIGKSGYDDIYKRIVDEGHTLALHSNTHEYSQIYTSVNSFMQDIKALSDKLERITGVKPTIMRFPGGSNNTVSHKYGGEGLMDLLVGKVTKEGYIYYDWNVDSTDATSNSRTKEQIFNAVMAGVEGKDSAIILMHDAAAKNSTAEALPQIVEGLKKKGFILEPITKETKPVQFNKA